MLIRFFKDNLPFPLYAVLPLLTFLFWIPGFIAFKQVDPAYQMPLYNAVSAFLFSFPNIVWFLSVGLIYFESILLNAYINKFEILTQRSNLPALFFVIITSAFSSFQLFHPVMISNLFLILAFGRICSIYRQDFVFAYTFDTGALIALASLFYFPAIIFFPLAWFSLAVIRPFIWREYVISLLGMLTPYALMVVYYLFTDNLEYLFKVVYYIPYLDVLTFNVGNEKYLYLIFAVLSILGIPRLVSISGLSVVRTQNLLKVIAFAFFIGICAFVLFRNTFSYTFMLLAFPLAVLLANYFITVIKQWIAEVVFLILILVAVFQYIY
jgi:hypothetical protein